MSDKAVGGVALTVSTVANSTFNGYAKVLTQGFSALSLLFVSELLTAFFVLFSYGLMPVIRHFGRLHRKDVFWIIVAGFFNGIVGPFLLFAGLVYTSAVNASFFGNTQMVFTVLLAALMLKEKILGGHYAAMLTIIIGTVIISLKGFTDGFSLEIGDALVIFSALGFALGSVYYRKYLSHVEPQLALFARSLIAMAAFFIISPFIRHPFISEVIHFPTHLIPALLGFGFISRFLSSMTFYQSMEKLTLTTVSLVGSLGLIGSVIFANWYLGEPIEWYHYVGGAFVILGTIMLEFIGTHPDEEHLEMHLKQSI
jgi:drug/metabolite transporter (DMT)-like permease